MNYDEQEVVGQVRRITLRDLRGWVRQGWIRPRESASGPVFDEIDIARIRLVCDLRKEMAIPSDTLPVVLSLIDQLHAARHDLRCLAEAVSAQAEGRKAAILETYRTNRNGEA